MQRKCMKMEVIMNDTINIDLTLKEIKTRRKSLFQHIKTRLESIDDLSFIENDDDDLEHAFKKEVQDDLEESRCQDIMRQFDMWFMIEREYKLDGEYWI